MRVAVLLSTYNGDKYLETQLDSLLNQDFKTFTVYIRDDGSTDMTLSIIERYINLYPDFIKLIRGGNIGVFRSFMSLLEEIEADYYMFCDQDDYWLENKISLSLKKIKELELQSPKKPAIVFTDLKLVDTHLNVFSESAWKVSKTIPDLALQFLNVTCPMAGCTMLFNKFARDVSIPVSDKGWVHDYWVALCVAKEKGSVIGYVEEPLILYRQHGANVIGTVTYPKNLLISKLKHFRKTIRVNRKNYRMVHYINGISLLNYIFTKIKYVITLNRLV